MPNDADLAGRTVLVVEDNYFIAMDTSWSLRGAGGDVLGPVAREDQALALIAGGAPTCAVLDINLGDGPVFAVPDALRDACIPFVFVTGYDDVVIPARFDGVERLRKPVAYGEVIQAMARLDPGRDVGAPPSDGFVEVATAPE